MTAPTAPTAPVAPVARALARAEWREAAAAHAARAAALLPADRSDPVTAFLGTYYSLRPAALRRWHPGLGRDLVDAEEHRSWRWYRTRDTDGGPVTGVDAPAFLDDRRSAVDHYRALLTATAARPPRLDCFGLHEWAMVHGSDTPRHDIPLRLGPAGTDAVVESLPLRCSHYDAYRFFTGSARPRNRWSLARADQVGQDQPGCVHVTMDLYKASYKLGPLVPGDLLLDCLDLARRARVVDMRASPYDLRAFGHDPITVETAEGRVEYASHQRDLAAAAAPLRERLLTVLQATSTGGVVGAGGC